MSALAKPVARLIDELSRLPGIGPKTASRLTFFLLRTSKEQVDALAEALRDLKEGIVLCRECFHISETPICSICADEQRDKALICVVEEPLDVLAIERTRDYKGLYHVLHGAISPMDGVGPSDLRINELLERLRTRSIREVILATNPNMEGDATAMYLAKLVQPMGVSVTRLGRGLPVGGDLEYADEMTLARALEGRRAF